MYFDAQMVEEVERKFGRPEEIALVRNSQKDGRAHDITLFIFRDSQLALIRKPSHPPGVFRAPGGGLRLNEPFEEGAKREAREETGLEIEIDMYLLRLQVRFTCGNDYIDWTTHVFCARAVGGELAPRDTKEIIAAQWASLEELQGLIREALLSSGWPLLTHRASLTDRVARILGGKAPCPSLG